MQKTPTLQKIKEEVFRGFIFALACITFSLLGITGIVYAASTNDGGAFGAMLRKILDNPNWQDPANDGTVRNAQRLGGHYKSEYVILSNDLAKRSCAPNKCVIGFESDGSVKCTP